MKKLAALILALMLMLSLTACGSAALPENNIGTDPAPVGDEKEDNIEKNNADFAEFNEIVVVDNEICLIKITDIEPDKEWGLTFKTYLENRSADTSYMFSVEKASINGVDCDPMFAAEVSPGKKANEDINFPPEKVNEDIIGIYSDVEMNIQVFNADDFSAPAVADETIHIYPYGEDKATKFVREAQDTDVVLVDNEDVTVIVTECAPRKNWGYCVYLYFVNKTDQNMMFSTDDVSVNGFMVDPYYSTIISAGKSKFDFMCWYGTSLEDNGITDVEEIEFAYTVSNRDDWTAEDFADGTITLNP